MPTKHDNVIILHTADSAATAYAKLGRLLLSEGHTIEKSDKDLGYINTGFRGAARNRAIESALNFSIIPHAGGALIEVRGKVRMPSVRGATSTSGDPIDFRSSFGSPIGIAWEEMNRLAGAYGAPALGYKAQR